MGRTTDSPRNDQMTTNRSSLPAPPLVLRAMTVAADQGFENSCAPEVGRLPQVLAQQVITGAIGEIGAGCGVDTAWLASGLQAGASLVTVEHDPPRASAVAELIADLPATRVITGDWHEILHAGSFALLFVDAGAAKVDGASDVVAALRPGGLAVLDDLTPEAHWPPEWQGQPDPVRDFWLNDPRLTAVELLTTPTTAVLLVARTP